MPAPEPPSLCSACGRDLPVDRAPCRCLGGSEPWLDGGRWALAGRRWRTATGAQATTYFGRVYAARGRGRVSFAQLVPPHYGALRGDLVQGLAGQAVLRDPPVDALLAALLGGAARGAILLRGVREIGWRREGSHRRMEAGHPGFDDVSVERVGPCSPEEDRVLAALLSPAPAGPTRAAAGYRGEAPRWAGTTWPDGPLGLVVLLAHAIAEDDLPESWLAAHDAQHHSPFVMEKTGRLLAELWADEGQHALVEELVRHLRFALRSALPARANVR